MAVHDEGLGQSNVLVDISTPLEPAVDIIAVHGMNAMGNETHAENTWTHDDTGTNWLRTLLPERVPSARILAFQYNANVALGTSVAGVEEQAVNLLGCLKMKRKDNPMRPLIFITHSLGGVIVKEALVTAFHCHEAYPMIWTFTYAVFFIAVPHKGSPCTSWGKIACNIVRAATNQPSNKLLESVIQHSDYNMALNTRFEPLHEAYKFYTWIEGRPTQPLGSIVPRDSATLGLPATQEFCRVANRNHRTICKFSGAQDPEWIELSATIVEAAQDAAKSVYFSPTMRHRKGMFETQALKVQDEKAVSLVEASETAQTAIHKLNEFRNSKELLVKQEEAHTAEDSMWTLAALLTAIVPILSLLSSFAFSWGFGYLALSGVIALLPSKEDALVKAQEGLEAEQKVMEIEEWAIEMLNDLQRDSLRSLRALERAMTACDLQGEDNEKALQANDALNFHRRLLEAILSITKELHGRQQSFNKAKHVSDRIGVIREEAANLDNKEFWMLAASKVEEEKKAQEEKKEKGEGDDSKRCCVIM